MIIDLERYRTTDNRLPNVELSLFTRRPAGKFRTGGWLWLLTHESRRRHSCKALTDSSDKELFVDGMIDALHALKKLCNVEVACHEYGFLSALAHSVRNTGATLPGRYQVWLET